MLATLFSPEVLLILHMAIIGAIAFFLIVSKNFTSGIYLWLLTILFFKYQKMEFADSIMPDMDISRIVFVLLLGIFILEVLARKRRLYAFTGIEYSMFFFCVLAIVSMVWTGSLVKQGGGLGIGELLTGYLVPFFMFYVSQHVFDTPEKRNVFIKFIVVLGAYLCLTAFFEHFNVHSLIWPKYILDPAVGIHFERARGPFLQAAVNGTALGFVLTSSFFFILKPDSKSSWRHLSWVLLALAPIAIFFTYTRATWIAGIMGFTAIMLFAMRHKKKIFLIITIALCLLTAVSLFFILDDDTMHVAARRAGNENPVYDRLNLYIASMNMFMDHPVLGVGFGRFSKHVMRYYENIEGIPFRAAELVQHDTFIGILAEMGIAGFALILSIYFLILSKSIRLYKSLARKPGEKAMVAVFWAIMAVFVVNSLFIEMKYFEFVNSLFFIFAGIIYGWERHYDTALAR
ncbi:MAG: O-antigen ligase family protein [Candidatus Gorgyraea atricola]|nr:O-antigen ligase family protein [Candidatus Gorgyraea atricola]